MSEGMQPARAKEVVALLSCAHDKQLDELITRYADDPRRQVAAALDRARRRAERERLEHGRVLKMYRRMREMGGNGIVLGVDEVGRGALAGPLTVCAVAIPARPLIEGINDSKQLTPAHREELAKKIRELTLAIGTCHIQPDVIDKQGMSRALRMAMSGAIEDSGVEPDAVLIDGNPIHVHPLEKTIVHGDALVACIAAASIVAKVTRDHIMIDYDAIYPGYHLAQSKGYGSAQHMAAIRKLGPTPIHRLSFCGNLLKQPTLF